MEQVFRYLLTTLIGIVACAQFIQVVTRYIFQVPIMGLGELTIIPTLWMYMLGAVNSSRENSQIKANVLEVFIKTERGHTLLALINESISFIISIWLTYWSWEYVQYAFRIKATTPILYIPTIIYDCSLFVGLVLINCFIFAHILRLKKQYMSFQLTAKKV